MLLFALIYPKKNNTSLEEISSKHFEPPLTLQLYQVLIITTKYI